MGNCSCFERERARVTAWGGGEDDHWGAPAEFSGGERGARGVTSMVTKEKDGAGSPMTTTATRRLKIRMTKEQLRRLLDGAGRGSAVEDVVAEIMSMGDVHVEQVEAEGHRPPPKLETIQEDDWAE